MKKCIILTTRVEIENQKYKVLLLLAKFSLAITIEEISLLLTNRGPFSRQAQKQKSIISQVSKGKNF